MATRSRTKSQKRAEEKDMRPRAVARYIRMSPYKVRQVLDIVRGKDCLEAVAILTATPRAAASVVRKLINSAAANAENNLSLSRDDLFIAEIFADQGPSLKRMQPRARGSAYRILKRTSHITVVLDIKEKTDIKVKKDSRTKAKMELKKKASDAMSKDIKAKPNVKVNNTAAKPKTSQDTKVKDAKGQQEKVKVAPDSGAKEVKKDTSVKPAAVKKPEVKTKSATEKKEVSKKPVKG